MKKVHDIVDLLSHYHELSNQGAKLTPRLFCNYIFDLTKVDLDYLRLNNWKIELVGAPSLVSPGAKSYEKIAPYYVHFADHNNCYSFAVDDLRGSRPEKSVPGVMTANRRRFDTRWQDCTVPLSLINVDSKITKSIRPADKTNIGKKNTYIVQFYVDKDPKDPYRSTDFHWYREVRPPPWLNHYIGNIDQYPFRPKVANKLFLEEAEKLLATLSRPGIVVKRSDQKTLSKYHGVRGYFDRKDMGNFDSNQNMHAVYANKAGNSDIVSIFSARGKIMLDPRVSDRGYSPNTNYDEFCSRFVVDTDKGRSSW